MKRIFFQKCCRTGTFTTIFFRKNCPQTIAEAAAAAATTMTTTTTLTMSTTTTTTAAEAIVHNREKFQLTLNQSKKNCEGGSYCSDMRACVRAWLSTGVCV